MEEESRDSINREGKKEPAGLKKMKCVFHEIRKSVPVRYQFVIFEISIPIRNFVIKILGQL